MAKKPQTAKPARILVCAITGKSFEYRGVGRPPKYSPEGKEIAAAKQRKKAYASKREAAGKVYTPRLSEAA